MSIAPVEVTLRAPKESEVVPETWKVPPARVRADAIRSLADMRRVPSSIVVVPV
jgi:hypothetical protein